MKKSIYFDALIAYTEKLSESACVSPTRQQKPFSKKLGEESYNIVYGYFLEVCKKFKLKVAFISSVDIIGPGLCRGFWSFENKKWIKNNLECSSNLIFDKFAPINPEIASHRKLFFSSNKVKTFNDPFLFELFLDKQKTYEKLSLYAIPTVSLEKKTKAGINEVCKKLAVLAHKHPSAKDFSTDIVMKDQFGEGGVNVYKFSINEPEKILETALNNPDISFVIQPFVKFDKGFSYHNVTATTDIRFVYLGGKIVQSYIRIAKNGDFRCNEFLCGSLTYLPLTEIPKKIVSKANLIAKVLKQKSSLYAIDFIISNNGNIYLLEGNSMPGLDWNMALKDNEIKAKKLIELIVKEIVVKTKVKIVGRLAKSVEKIKNAKNSIPVIKSLSSSYSIL